MSKDGQTKYLSARVGDKTPRVIGDDVVTIDNESTDGGIDGDEIPF
mgnify:FL=1